MKVLLTKDVSGLGRKDEIKEVSEGYARNFLILKHFAVPATSQVLAKVQKELKEEQEKIKKDQAYALALKNKFSNKTISITAKADKQRLFAAIHEQQLAEAINQKLKSEIKPTQIKIQNQIKTVGIHEVEIKLTENINAKVKIEVKAA